MWDQEELVQSSWQEVMVAWMRLGGNRELSESIQGVFWRTC